MAINKNKTLWSLSSYKEMCAQRSECNLKAKGRNVGVAYMQIRATSHGHALKTINENVSMS